MNKTYAIVLGAVVLMLVFVTLVVAAGLVIGVALNGAWGQGSSPSSHGYGGPGMMGNWDEVPRGRGYGGPGMMWQDRDGASFGPAQEMSCAEGYAGRGMMRGGWEAMPCDQGDIAPDGKGVLSLKDAETAVERYVERLGYGDLHVTEVMEFEHNFYAIVAEEDTGIGAMELLVDRSSGAVGPEPGPNMMWNAEYGMHRGGRMGMMGGYATDEMTVSPAEVEEIAQRWLDDNLPGRAAGEADPFYGYYTLHFLQDGEIEGMLSVHGSSGDVWFHNWHGGFVTMAGGHE